MSANERKPRLQEGGQTLITILLKKKKQLF